MAAKPPIPVDPEKLDRLCARWAALGLPVTPEARAFLAKPKQSVVGVLKTDAQTLAEDAAEENER